MISAPIFSAASACLTCTHLCTTMMPAALNFSARAIRAVKGGRMRDSRSRRTIFACELNQNDNALINGPGFRPAVSTILMPSSMMTLLPAASNEGGKSDTTSDPSVGVNRSVHTLVNVNAQVKKGQLVAVVGPVGSGMAHSCTMSTIKF